MPRGTILIVDDDDAVRETMTDVLVAGGYEVVGAANGRIALDLLLADPSPLPAPRLILLDLMMPVMNGGQFLGALQDHPRLASLPVVIVSARERGDAGAGPSGAAHLQKPFDATTLLELARAYFG